MILAVYEQDYTTTGWINQMEDKAIECIADPNKRADPGILI